MVETNRFETSGAETRTVDKSPENAVLVVDDSPLDIHIINDALKHECTLFVANSGERAIDMLAQGAKPKVILMDVSMQGMSGYEACEIITKKYDIDVIFVSANDSTDEILKGYNVGGIDYIIKPFDVDVMTSKVRLALRNRAKLQADKNQNPKAPKKTFCWQTAQKEMTILTNFLYETFNHTGLDGLIEAALTTLEQLGIDSSIQIQKAQEKPITKSKNGIVPALECELLSRARGMGKPYIGYGKRNFFCLDEIVILTKNMPVDDHARHENLKTLTEKIAKGFHARLRSFAKTSDTADAMKAELDHIVTNLEDTFDYLKDTHENYKKKSMRIMDDMLQDVEHSFFSLGLSEEQEKNLLTNIKGAVEQSLDHYEKSAQFDEEIISVIEQLSFVKEMK